MSKFDFLNDDAIAIVEAAPTDGEVYGYLDVVQNKYLSGIRLALDMDLTESQLFTEQALANIVDSSPNLNVRAAQIRDMAMAEPRLLAQLVPVALREEFALATSVAAIQTAPRVGNIDLGGGLPTISGDMLVTGVVGDGDAYRVAASAVTLGSSMLSMTTAGMSFGPIGAIGGFALAGIKYLSGGAAEHNARLKAREIQRQNIATELERLGNEYLRREWGHALEDLEVQFAIRDQLIRKLADSWAAYELSMGVRFGLRYFPGEARPLRAGVAPKIAMKYVSDDWCRNASGCLYFPEPQPSCYGGNKASMAYRDCYRQLLEQLDREGKTLSKSTNPDPAKAFAEGHVPPYSYSSYFDRTLRAFASWGGRIPWVPQYGSVAGMSRETVKRQLEFPPASEVWADAAKGARPDLARGAYQMAPVLRTNPNMGGPQWEKTFGQVMSEFVSRERAKLDADFNSMLVVYNRLNLDLLRTANNVAGELVAGLRLKRLQAELGTLNLQQLTAQDAATIRALSDAEIQKLYQLPSSGPLALGILGLGLGAAGVGAYAKWGHKLKGRR